MSHWEVFYFGVPACLANSIVSDQWLEAGVAPGDTDVHTNSQTSRQTDIYTLIDWHIDLDRMGNPDMNVTKQS